MKHLAPVLRLGVMLTPLVLCACTAIHEVDTVRLEAAKERTFRVTKVEIPCNSLSGFPSIPFFMESISDKEHQIALLKSIPTDEILRALSDRYGITVSYGEDLVLDPTPVHFMALVSQNIGRCWNLKNAAADANGDTVDIQYTLTSRQVPLMPLKVWLGYYITVKSEGSTLIRHEDDIGSFEYSVFEGFPTQEAFEKIKHHATQTPFALRRDMEK